MKTSIVKSIKETNQIIDVDWLRKTLKGSPNKTKETMLLTFPLVSSLCEIEIDNIPTEFANAILRSTIAEQEHYALDVDYQDIYRTDKDINVPFLVDNINLIPLKQGITDNEVDKLNMVLDITNTTDSVIIVRTGDISFKGSVKPNIPLFLPTIELTTLNPGCRIKIDNIKIKKGVGFQHTKFLVGVNGRIWPVNIEGSGQPLTTMKTHYLISFKLNCVNPKSTKIAHSLLITGIANLIERLNYVKQVVEEDNKIIMKSYDKYIELTLRETNTIAKLLERACYILYPKVATMNAILTYHNNTVKLTLVSTDAKRILIDIVNQCIKIYQDIILQINKL